VVATAVSAKVRVWFLSSLTIEQQKRDRAWEKRKGLRRERATKKERDSMREERRESLPRD
jgi:hypothetical protein